MDRRKERTRSSIINAFLELRSKKAIEKITVRELCERAGINKSTFYVHFQDIYDLSEQLENQTAADIIDSIGHPEYMFTRPEVFVRELYGAYTANSQLIHLLFSGSRSELLIVRIEQSLKETICRLYPRFRDSAAASTLFTLEIYGQFHAYMKCRRFGDETVIAVLCDHWQKTVEYLREQKL